MSIGRFWLGETGSESLFHPDGFSLTIEDFELNREGRVANGDLVIDRIAVKKRFRIAYTTAVGQTALDELISLYTTGTTQALSLIVDDDAAVQTTYSVKFRPFSRTRMLTQDIWLWNPITFALEEI